MLEWDLLSMKLRAAFIRNAVARGIYNVEDIVLDYNEFRKGGPMETPIYEDLPKMLRKAGLDIKVTSGYRPAGTVGNAGQRSWHHRHGAVDIIPQGNTTFEDIENVLHNNPAIRQYMLSHNFGLIDESGRTPESKLTMKKTGATGAHFHIGKDSKYASLYRQRVGAALPEGDKGKTVYFTNPFLPLEQPTQLVLVQRTVTPEEILQSVVIPEPIKSDEDIQAIAELPEVEVIGHQPLVNPLTILSLIQENAPAPLALEPYLIPLILNKVNEIATERNSFLQKDLEDRILAEERRRRLGYSYRDSSIEDDIKLMQFLRNMSANGGSLFGGGGDTTRYSEEEDAYDAGTFPTTYVTPYGNFNATLYPWLSALLARSLQYDEVNPLLGDNETPITLRSIVNGKPGRLNTAVIAPEWITRVALAALSKGYDPALPIALMSRESTIGNDTDGPTTAKLWNKESIEELRKLGVDPYKTEQHIGLPFNLSELRKQVRQNNIEEYPYVLPNLSYRYNTMIGNHDFYDDKFPYYRMYDEAINNVGLDRAAIDEWLSKNYKTKDFEAIPTDPIIDALDYYKTGKYNSGWKGQYPAVLREYNEVINNPLIMSIINNTKGLGGNLFEMGGPEESGRVGVTDLSTWDEIAAQSPLLYTLGKAIDPTGVSGYGDARQAISQYDSNPSIGSAYDAVMETLGALPIVSKAGKAIKFLQGAVTGQGVFNDYNYAQEKKKEYGDELVVDYWDNTVKPRREAERHGEQMKSKMAYIDIHHVPSFKLAPKGSKPGQVISDYDINHRVVKKYKKALGGPLNTYLDTNSYGGGGLMPGINIPSVAKNLYNKAKDRLYRTITPQGYHLGRAAKEFIKGDTRDFSKFTPAENEVWARYLGVPYEGESNFEKAIYTPTKGGATYDDVIKFKDESLILSDDVLRQLLQNQMKTGKNTMLVDGNESGLGTYTLSLGEDKNGKYISYYDDWDINFTRGLSAKYKIPLIELIGDIVPGSNPFTVYGRRYYTDEDLRRVIER